MQFKYFIGIDVSASWLDLALCSEGLSAAPKRRVSNDDKGFACLFNWLIKQVGKASLAQSVFILEHTGLYDLELTHFLHDQGLAYSHLSPMEIRYSLGLQRGKNDQVDALRIANYGLEKRHKLPLSQPAPKDLFKLQRLMAQRDLLVKHRTALKNHNAGLTRLKDDFGVQDIIHTHQQLIQTYNHYIAQIERQCKQIIGQNQALKKNFQLLLSIPGIGPINAFFLLIKTQNFSAFDNWRQFACYVGTAPFEHRSGSSVNGKTRVSHRANKRLKSLLSRAAGSAVQHCFEIRDFFLRKKQQGKPPGWIFNAIRNKIIARVFAVIKRQTPYKQIDKIKNYAT